MLRESYMSGVWLAWCHVKSSSAARERARREAEELERERQDSARRTAAPPALEAPAGEDELSTGLQYMGAPGRAPAMP